MVRCKRNVYIGVTEKLVPSTENSHRCIPLLEFVRASISKGPIACYSSKLERLGGVQ